ncbi:hypothetical protein [Desertibacillus haloalkaliphilus]|uniref:hypothetical protein n=1 Tax=Desertibacillus haloalkaliphilus TaxID=1328930 RepID=UPI001C278463|nr:hypothetical protein [Desertibacillus haloalkaliphilus]
MKTKSEQEILLDILKVAYQKGNSESESIELSAFVGEISEQLRPFVQEVEANKVSKHGVTTCSQVR